MVLNMKEQNQSTPLKNCHPEITKNFFNRSMKAKDKTNCLSNKKKYRMGNHLNTDTKRYDNFLSSCIQSFTINRPVKYKMPEIKPKNDVKTILDDSLDDDVVFLQQKSAKPFEKRNIPRLNDVKYDKLSYKDNKNSLINVPTSILNYGAFDTKHKSDKWDIQIFLECSKDITKRFQDEKNKSFQTKATSSKDYSENLNKYQAKIRENNLKFEKFSFLNPFRRILAPEPFKKILSHHPLYIEKPVVEDVELLRPKIEYKLPEFTEEMQKTIKDAFRKQSIRNEHYELKLHDLESLSGSKWLNDEVMNNYLKLIQIRAQSNGLNIRCFNSFLFAGLKNGTVTDRYMRKEDFLKYDLIMFPIHLDSHWRLMKIDVPNKTISYYDSLGYNLEGARDMILNFLSSRSLRQRNEVMNIDEWNYVCFGDEIPIQKNGYDCGVFALKYADCIAKNIPFFFSQEDMPIIRKLILYELITGKLL